MGSPMAPLLLSLGDFERPLKEYEASYLVNEAS